MHANKGYVAAAGHMPARTGSDAGLTMHVPIDHTVGCRSLEQRILRVSPGHTGGMRNPSSEDVLYVISGTGTATIGDARYPLTPGIGALAPPDTPYRFENPGPEPLLLVSVLSPGPGQPTPPAGEMEMAPLGHLTVNEATREDLSAGDRRFKLMVTPRMGCRNLTQFLGFIPPGRAPFHSNTYEEVIYIIEGEGVVHIGDDDFAVSAGASVYLPPLLEHCIENTSAYPMRLLGVFCPAGDPSSKATERADGRGASS